MKPSQIKVPELRVRARFDQEIWAQFQNSIKEAGIVSPVIVCQIKEDLVLVDGEHRLQEAISRGIPMVDAVVFEGDMVDVLTKNLFLDHTRGKTPISEMVKVIGALYTEYGLDPDQIKEKTGLTRDYIEKLVKISLASPSVQQALDEGVIGVGHAFELCRLPYAIQQEEIIAKHQVWRFSVKELHEQIDGVLHAIKELAEAPTITPLTGTRPAPVYHCEGCKGEVEPRYLRPVMLCPNCFGEVWRLAKAHPAPEVEAAEETPPP
ncbi:hypothetical protein ES708_01546 [subsurface metagenome]